MRGRLRKKWINNNCKNYINIIKITRFRCFKCLNVTSVTCFFRIFIPVFTKCNQYLLNPFYVFS